MKIYIAFIILLVAVASGVYIFKRDKQTTSNDETVRDSSIEFLELNLDLLRNTEYKSSAYSTPVKLESGNYFPEPSSGESQSDWYTKLDEKHTTFGDLNNDGINDAVVILETRAGGTGVSRDLAIVLNYEGRPVNIATQFLGDRASIFSVKIDSLKIFVDMELHEYESVRETHEYVLTEAGTISEVE